MKFLLILCLIPLIICLPTDTQEMKRRIIEQMNITCENDGVTVALDYDLQRHQTTLTRQLSNDLRNSVFISPYKADECKTNKTTVDNVHYIHFTYDGCDMDKRETLDGISHTGHVAIELYSGSSDSQYVAVQYSCTVLLKPLPLAELTVYIDDVRNEEYETNQKKIEPLNTGIHNLLRMEFLPLTSDETMQNVFVYPTQCWTQSVKDSTDKVVLLKDGCPVKKGARTLAALFQKDSTLYTASSTSVYFTTTSDVLPLTSYNSTRKSYEINVACEYYHCSASRLERIDGVPLCPSIAACADQAVYKTAVAEGHLLTTVFKSIVNVDTTKVGTAQPIFNPIHEPTELADDSPRDVAHTTFDKALLWMLPLMTLMILAIIIIFVCIICFFNGDAVCSKFTDFLDNHFMSERLRKQEMIVLCNKYRHVDQLPVHHDDDLMTSSTDLPTTCSS